jgi:TetR/AcrR family fatty acid metabolism transcriptional regulator
MDKASSEQLIIEAALRVFSAKGFADTRMADVANEANLSYGLIYHYFQNKEALFDAIVDDWWSTIYGKMEALKKTDASTREKLTGVIKFMMNAYTEMPHHMVIFISEVSRGFISHASPQRKDNFNKFISLCEDIVLEGQTGGALRNDIPAKHLTYVFLGAIDAFLSVMVLGKEKLTRARENRIVESVISVFINGAEAGRRH